MWKIKSNGNLLFIVLEKPDSPYHGITIKVNYTGPYNQAREEVLAEKMLNTLNQAWNPSKKETVTASMTVTQPVHLMGPEGEIIATLSPHNEGQGIALDFDFEKVEVKANGHHIGWDIENLTVNLAQPDTFNPETCSHQAAVEQEDGTWYCPGCESVVPCEN